MPVPMYARYTSPWRFFGLATAIPWALWFVAAATSRVPGLEPVTTALALAGLAAPFGVVLWMTRHRPDLRRDIAARLTLRGVSWRWILFAAAGMQIAVLVGTAISVLFGYSADQFAWRGGATFSVGLMSGWVALVVAPVLEELAWHSYGTDALRTRFSVFTTSMIFGVIWAVWHLPLAFLQGSSQQQTAAEGWLHALNFPVSMIPFVLLMNWMYYRTGRNVLLTVLFHLGANLSTQVIATHPDTELIVTGLLLVVTAFVLARDRALFFDGPARQHAGRAAEGLPTQA